MQRYKTILGVAALFTFMLMAGSVVCLATSQASVMNDCGTGTQTAAVCPFMSVSIPAMANTSSAMKIFGMMIALFFAAGFLLYCSSQNDRSKKSLAHIYEKERDSAVGRRSDIVLNLISDGILHSRVFGF